MKHRYEVVNILSGRFGDAVLMSTDDCGAAKKAAEGLAAGSYYGTAIIDTQEQTADLGDRIVPIRDAFRD